VTGGVKGIGEWFGCGGPSSLGLFGIDNPLRWLCRVVMGHWAFDTFIAACIMVSSICLAMDEPRLAKTGTVHHSPHALL